MKSYCSETKITPQGRSMTFNFLSRLPFAIASAEQFHDIFHDHFVFKTRAQKPSQKKFRISLWLNKCFLMFLQYHAGRGYGVFSS